MGVTYQFVGAVSRSGGVDNSNNGAFAGDGYDRDVLVVGPGERVEALVVCRVFVCPQQTDTCSRTSTIREPGQVTLRSITGERMERL